MGEEKNNRELVGDLVLVEIVKALREPRQPEPQRGMGVGAILLTSLFTAILMLGIGGAAWWLMLPSDDPNKDIPAMARQLASKPAPTRMSDCPDLPPNTILIKPFYKDGQMVLNTVGEPVVGVCPKMTESDGTLKKGTIKAGMEIRLDPAFTVAMRPRIIEALMTGYFGGDLGGYSPKDWFQSIPAGDLGKDIVRVPTLGQVQAAVQAARTSPTAQSPPVPASQPPAQPPAAVPVQAQPPAPTQAPAAQPAAPAAAPKAAQPAAQPVPTQPPAPPPVKVVTVTPPPAAKPAADTPQPSSAPGGCSASCP